MKKKNPNREEKDLKERYMDEARRFVEALGNNASPNELQNIRRNSKEILKGMLQKFCQIVLDTSRIFSIISHTDTAVPIDKV